MRSNKQAAPPVQTYAVRVCRLCGNPIHGNSFVWAKKKMKKGNSYSFMHNECYENLCGKKEEKV